MNAKLLELIDECDKLILLAKKEKNKERIIKLEGRKQGLIEALSIYRSEKSA